MWDKVCIDEGVQVLDQTMFELVLTTLKDLRKGVKVKMKDSVMDPPVIAINIRKSRRPYIRVVCMYLT